jgi:DNA-binding MarR family transcriptional regulator
VSECIAADVDDVAELLDALNRRIRSAARRELVPLGVTPAQVRALRCVAGGHAPMRMSTIADRLGIARRSTTSVVDQLEALGLVARHQDPADGRGVAATPTPAGRRTLARVAALRRAAANRVLGGLSDDERAELATLLRRLAAPESAAS